MGSVDVVAKWQERVRRQADARVFREPRVALRGSKRFRRLLQLTVEMFALGRRELLPQQVAIDDIGEIRSPQLAFEAQSQRARMLRHEPLVSLVAGQSCAVHAGLLARAHAHHLSLPSHAHGIGLGVLQRDGGDDQCFHDLRPHIAPAGNNVVEQRRRDRHRRTVLLELHAKHIAALECRWLEVRIHLQDQIGAAFLFRQPGKCVRVISRRDDAVGYFPREHLRQRIVDDF